MSIMDQWKAFGYNNIRLSVPLSWDLLRCNGDACRGEITLDNSKELQLELQWGKLGAHKLDSLEKQLIKNRKDFAIERNWDLKGEHRAYLIQSEIGRIGFSIVVERSAGRFLAARYFRPPANMPDFAERVMAPMFIPVDQGHRWCFFSTAFDLPSGFLLQESQMKAGMTKLVFLRNGRRLTLWDISLLKRLENMRAPVDFAKDLVQREYPKRLVLDCNRLVTGEDKARFSIPGSLRLRWYINPLNVLKGNTTAVLYGVPNRGKDRLTILLWQYRIDNESKWIAGMPASIENAKVDECWEKC